jgi:titin
MRLLFVVLTLLLASPAWAASVDLNWRDNADNEQNTEVERKSEACGTGVGGGLAFARIATVGLNIVTFKDLSIAPGTYCYRVRATNAVGPSAYSNTAEVFVPVPPSVPAAPTSLTAQPVN